MVLAPLCAVLTPARDKAKSKATAGVLRRSSASYGSEVEFFWNQGQRDYVYYKKLRKLVKMRWSRWSDSRTDTVKCQKKDDKKSFNHSDFSATVRRCVGKYLHQEVEACPDKWIAIGVGRDAFAALRLVCLKHFVLAFPIVPGNLLPKRTLTSALR